MSGVAPDPAALTDLIARLRHDGALEPEVALMGLEFRYLNDVADALEVLVARTTEAEAERSAALQIIGLLVSRAGGEVVITDREVVGSGPFDVGWFESIDPPARKIVVREHAYGVTTEGEPG